MSNPSGHCRLAVFVLAALLGASLVKGEEPAPPPGPEEPPAPPRAPEVQEVVVTATRTPQQLEDLGNNVSVIGREELSDRPAAEIESLLGEQTGVDVQGGSFPGLRPRVNVRGAQGRFGAQRMLLLQDGRPLNEEYQGDFDFRLLSPDNVERVEVLRGPGSALYGSQALGAVVNLVTCQGKPGRPLTEITGISGDHDTYITALRHGASVGPYDYFVTARHTETDGYLTTPFGDARDWAADSATANVGWKLDSTSEMRFSADYTSAEGTQNYYDETLRRGSFDLRFDSPGAGPGELTLRVYRNDFGQNLYWNPLIGGGVSRFDQFTWGSQAIYTVGMTERQRFSLGLDLDRKDVATDEPAGEVSADRVSTGLYVQDEVSLSDKVTLTAGLRWDWDEDFQGSVSPRLGVVWRPREETKLYFLVGRAYRVPSFSDLYLPLTAYGFDFYEGNTDLDPETMWSGEVGVSRELAPGCSVSLSTFINEIDDGWDYVQDPDTVYRPHNIAEMRSAGVEADCEAELAPGLTAYARYTFTDAEYSQVASSISQLEGNKVEDVPPHTAAVGLRYEARDGAVFGLGARYADNRYTDAENTGAGRLRRFGVLDAYFSAPVGERLRVFAQVLNLTDVTYYEMPGEPQPGRTFFAGLTMSF